MSEFIGNWMSNPPGLTGLDAFQFGGDGREFVHMLLGKPAPVVIQ